MLCWCLSNNPNGQLIYMYFNITVNLYINFLLDYFNIIYDPYLWNKFIRWHSSVMDIKKVNNRLKLACNAYKVTCHVLLLCLFYKYRYPFRHCDDWFGKFLGWRLSSTVLVCHSFYFKFMNLIFSSHSVKLYSSSTSSHWLHSNNENNYVSFKTFCARW